MPKEKDGSPNETDIKRERAVEAFILGFQEANEGRFPQRRDIIGKVPGSFRELGPAMKRVQEKLLATQTLLARMPEIPDPLRLTGEQFVKEIWVTARDMADADLKEVRLAHAAREDEHRRQFSDVEACLYQVEEEMEAEAARANAAEARIKVLEADLAEVTRERDALQARLEERSELFALLGRGKKEDGVVSEANEKPQGRGKPGRGSENNDDPETADLPMN